MMRCLIQISFILLFIGCSGGTGNLLRENPPLSHIEWAEDLKVLAKKLPQSHANAFHSVSRSEFESRVTTLHNSLPGLSQDSVYVGFRQIVTIIGDGHTNIAIPANWPLLPLRFRWFGDPVNNPSALQLRVTRATGDFKEVIGARVTGIGDSPISAVYETLTTIIGSGETVGSSHMASSVLMIWPHILRGLGIASEADSVRFTFTDEFGQEFERWVKPYTPGKKMEWHDASTQTPLYMTRRGNPFWHTRLPYKSGDSTIVYLAFNGYPNYLSFWRQSRALLKFIDRHDPVRLVIDLRNNTGGDFKKTRRLLIPGLRKRISIRDPGNFYVLIGPVTFSAAMTNAVDFRRELDAILVGEPTGARPNQYQESGDFRLPNSRLRVTVSTRYYKFQGEDTPGVLPDIHIVPTWEDWLAGRDPALEWILLQPLNQLNRGSIEIRK